MTNPSDIVGLRHKIQACDTNSLYVLSLTWVRFLELVPFLRWFEGSQKDSHRFEVPPVLTYAHSYLSQFLSSNPWRVNLAKLPVFLLSRLAWKAARAKGATGLDLVKCGMFGSSCHLPGKLAWACLVNLKRKPQIASSDAKPTVSQNVEVQRSNHIAVKI